MLKSISITTKVWLSVGILVLGYFGSMAFGFYLGRQTEIRLNIIAESFFPATAQGQFALIAFREEVEGYYNAVMIGSAEGLEKATLKSREVFSAINEILKLKKRDLKFIQRIFRLKKRLKQYNKMASEVYTVLVSQEDDYEVIEMLNRNERSLMKKTVSLAAEEKELRNELLTMAGELSSDLHKELASISSITRRQRYLNLFVFFAVVTIALSLIAWIVYRSITQPLEKTYMLENAVKQSIDGVAVADLNGHFSFINQSWAAMHGYEVEELIGQHFSIVYDEARFKENVQNFAREVFKKGSHTGEMIHQKKDGTYFPILVSINLLSDENGKPHSMVGIGKDITEQKKNEKILEETRQALIEKAHQAGMADIATGTLHNVGNILNSVTTSSQMIYELVRGSQLSGLIRANVMLRENMDHIEDFICNDPKGKKLMQYYLKLEEGLLQEHGKIKKHVDRLNDKVEAIIDVISAQQTYAGTMALSEELNVIDIVEDAVMMQSASLQKHNIRVLKKSEEIPTILLQKVKLLHILINLIENAKDAMIDIDPNDRELVFDISRSERAVFIKISDTGIGISPENLERIFSHGFTTKKSGHGFGLHSCANYMTEMGGRMWAESEGVGKGATFILRFQV